MTLAFEGFRIYALDRHRLRLPKEISELLPWHTAGEACDVLAMPSPHGGLVVLSPEARDLRDRTLQQLEEEQPLVPETLASVDFARALRLRISWTVRIGPDQRFTLPSDARDAGLVPASPDAKVAVAVVMGAIQVWGSAQLASVLRALSAQQLPS